MLVAARERPWNALGMADVETWLEGQCDRVLHDQRARVESAKVVVTFSTGLAAALLGVALSSQGGVLKWAAIWTFIPALGLAIAVLFVDRIKMPDHVETLDKASSSSPLHDLRQAALAAVDLNDEVVARVRRAAHSQLVVGGASIMLSLACLIV